MLLKASKIRLGTRADLGKKLKLGAELDHCIELTPKVPGCDVIIAMLCLASPKFLAKH